MLCSETRLRALLTAQEESGLFREVSRHVEECPHCCARLLELSGEEEIVREACETLRIDGVLTECDEPRSSSVLVTIDSLQGSDVPIDYESVPLDFLSPASHPEMLGRLGRYEIEKVVGTGGMGVVLKAYDTELHRVVAVKVLLPHLASSGAARRRFSREAQAAAAVVHDHVIPIYNVESDGNIPYLVMQYVPGDSLQARIDEHGPLDVPEILRIARQAAAGLAAAHDQGVIHRDVKPANLLLEDSLDRVLISDFGLARTVDDATLTRTGIVAGTPHYMSPEQASGEVIDFRTDLFSLGSVLYFMCTGRPPFRADAPMAVLNRICHAPHRPVDEVNPAIPVDLADIVERLLAKAPARRFSSARELEARLSTILSELQQGGRLRRRGWWRRWSRVARHWRKAAQLASAGVLCVLVGMFISGREPLLPQGDPDRTGNPVQVVARQAGSDLRPAGPNPVTESPLEPDTFDSEFRTTLLMLRLAEAASPAEQPSQAGEAGLDPWDQERLAVESQIEWLTQELGGPRTTRAPSSSPAVRVSPPYSGTATPLVPNTTDILRPASLDPASQSPGQ